MDSVTATTETQRLPLFDGLVNPSVAPDDEDRISDQAQRVYARLKHGPATNIELHNIALQYNARIYEIRRFFTEHAPGWEVHIISKRTDGVNVFAIITPDGKVYPAEADL